MLYSLKSFDPLLIVILKFIRFWNIFLKVLLTFVNIWFDKPKIVQQPKAFLESKTTAVATSCQIDELTRFMAFIRI